MKELKHTLDQCLKESAVIIKKGFGKSHTIRKKAAISIVTEVDMAVDQKVRKIISRAFPDHQIMTEEQKDFKSASPYRWIIDPLDGTTNFAHGIPIFCTSIGLEYQGKMILGGIYNPISNELFSAEKGRGAYLNGKRIRVSGESKLIDSLLVTGFPYDGQERAEYYLSFVQAFMQKCRGIRRLGAAAIDLAYVACGKFEAYWEFNIMPWDIAAGLLIVEEAGGRVTDFRGGPVDIDHPKQILASNVTIQPKMLEIFSKNLKK